MIYSIMKFTLAAIIDIFISSFGDSVNATLIKMLDVSLPTDILQSYFSHIASTRASCSAATIVSATSSSFDFPGTNLNNNSNIPLAKQCYCTLTFSIQIILLLLYCCCPNNNINTSTPITHNGNGIEIMTIIISI